MIVGAYCKNPKCENGKNKTLFNNITDLVNRGLGGWNGPWECPDCHQEMATVREDTDKDDGQKRPPTKPHKRKVANTSSSKSQRKKTPPKKKTGRKYIGKRP
jgi:hypothetical protein